MRAINEDMDTLKTKSDVVAINLKKPADLSPNLMPIDESLELVVLR